MKRFTRRDHRRNTGVVESFVLGRRNSHDVTKLEDKKETAEKGDFDVRMLVVDLFEQVLDIALDALVIHRRQDGFHRLCFGQSVKLMTPVDASQLEDQG